MKINKRGEINKQIALQDCLFSVIDGLCEIWRVQGPPHHFYDRQDESAPLLSAAVERYKKKKNWRRPARCTQLDEFFSGRRSSNDPKKRFFFFVQLNLNHIFELKRKFLPTKNVIESKKSFQHFFLLPQNEKKEFRFGWWTKIVIGSCVWVFWSFYTHAWIVFPIVCVRWISISLTMSPMTSLSGETGCWRMSTYISIIPFERKNPSFVCVFISFFKNRRVDWIHRYLINISRIWNGWQKFKRHYFLLS